MIPPILNNKNSDANEFYEAYMAFYKKTIDYDLFYEKIKDLCITYLDCYFYPFQYYKAHYLFVIKNKLKDSIYIVDHLIDFLEGKDKLESETEESNLSQLRDFLGYRYFKDIYMLAGEVYAKSGDKSKALEYYIKYQYYSCQLKTEFQNALEHNRAFVYSFRTLNKYALSDLINHEITVVHPSKMNDPFDTFALLWSKEENLEKTCTSSHHIKPYSQSFQYYKIRSFVGNQELTHSYDITKNILMWSHYANSHSGFCIEYKLSSAFIKATIPDSYKHHYLKRVEYENKLDLYADSIDTTEGYASKSKEWQYEKEVRLISYDPTCKKDNLQIPLDSDSCIHAIYFGHKCSESDRKTITKLLGDKIKYYNMMSDPNDIYNLLIEKYENTELDSTIEN